MINETPAEKNEKQSKYPSKLATSDTSKIKMEHKSNFKENVSWLIGAIGFIILIIGFVEVRIEQKINNSVFLNKVASAVRPALIFDSNESIHANMGAENYIKEIKITKKPSKYDTKGTGDLVDLQIIITPEKHLHYSPIIEPIDSNTFDQTSKRGAGHEWVYELTRILESNNNPLFRLEVINQR